MYAKTHEDIVRCQAEKRCINCGETFSKENIFTELGALETQISGMCEICFDALEDFAEDEQ